MQPRDEDIERTDTALGAERARHDQPRDKATEAAFDAAMEEERRNETRGRKPGTTGSQTRLLPVLAALASAALIAVGAVGATTVLDIGSDTEVNAQTTRDACIRDNQLRREVNRQAEAFVHHNDATLEWAIVVRRILDRSTQRGEDAFHATNKLVGEYRKVRKEYFTLPTVDCFSRPREPREPRKPIAP